MAQSSDVDLGIYCMDTAEFYGPYENERLLGRALRGRRDRAVIATKFGFTVGGGGKPFGRDSRPVHIMAWLLHQWDCIVPIPGTKRRKYLRENVEAAELRLEAADLAWLNERIPTNAAAGDRYNAAVTATLDQT